MDERKAKEFVCPCGVTVGLWFSERLSRHACPVCWDDGRLVLVTDEDSEKVIGRIHLEVFGGRTWWIAEAFDGVRTYKIPMYSLQGACEKLESWLRWNPRVKNAKVWKETEWTE